MKKNTFWFYHDYHARTDARIISLVQKKGWEGYGLYWAIIEKLHEAGGWLDEDPETLAYDLRIETEKVTSILRDFGLFISKKKKFSANRVLANLQKKESASKIARENINKRWDKSRHLQQGKGYGGNTPVLGPNYNGNTDAILGEEKRGEEKRIPPNPPMPGGGGSGQAGQGDSETAETAETQGVFDHVEQSWQAKKKNPIQLRTRDKREIAALIPVYQQWGVKALWDVYLEDKDPFVLKNGHSVRVFFDQIPRLLDQPGYKPLAAQYQSKLKPSFNVWDVITLNTIGGKV